MPRRGRGAPDPASWASSGSDLGERPDPVLTGRRAGYGRDRGPGQPVPLLRVLRGHRRGGWRRRRDGQLDHRRRPRHGPVAFDVRRFGAPHNVPAYLEQRSINAYSHYYEIAFPNRELAAPRGSAPQRAVRRARVARRGPRYEVRVGAGQLVRATRARRPSRRPPSAAVRPGRTSAMSTGRPRQGRHHRPELVRQVRIAGPGGLRLLQTVAGANLDVPVGKIVYTQLLNARGGIEADVTITRLSDERFYLVTGSGFGRHDLTFILQHAPSDGSVEVTDVTSAFGVLNLCGPLSREVAQRISPGRPSNEAFAYMTAQTIDVGQRPGAGAAGDLRRRARLGAPRSGRVRARPLREVAGRGGRARDLATSGTAH